MYRIADLNGKYRGFLHFRSRAIMSGYPCDIMWRNKYASLKSEVRVH